MGLGNSFSFIQISNRSFSKLSYTHFCGWFFYMFFFLFLLILYDYLLFYFIHSFIPGPVKELRETPSKKHQKFVEFYDVRDAAKALKEMNGKEIHGKPIVIEFSRPGGHSRKFMNAMAAHNNNNLSISAAAATISSINSINNFYPRIQKYHPAAPPPYLPRKFSGRSALTGVDHTPPPSFASSQPQFFSKKSNFGKGIVNGNVNKNTTSSNNVASSLGGVEYKMNALNLGGGGAVCDGIEDKGDSNGHNNNNNNPKRLTKRSHSNQPTTVTVLKQQQQQQQHQQPRTRPRKGRQAKKFDSRFLINEDALTESNCRDSRTTVMIKNIPNKYRFGLTAFPFPFFSFPPLWLINKFLPYFFLIIL